MKYEKLSKRALGCMYVATFFGSLFVLAGVVFLFLFLPMVMNGKLANVISGVLLVFVLLNILLSPYFRYHRYRYSINDECIDIQEGYLFVKRHIVPIERLHKLETQRGPIDRIFKVAKVKVTTAGGDVTIRFVDEEMAERIADTLKTRINQIVVEQREENGRK